MQIISPLTEALIDEYRKIIGTPVSVVMDRPKGAVHPKHPNLIYPINYGYVDGLIGGDGEEQDVYVLGQDNPLERFDGVVVAVVHRYDDNECKWVACKEDESYTAEEIRKLTNFQEQYYHIEVITK